MTGTVANLGTKVQKIFHISKSKRPISALIKNLKNDERENKNRRKHKTSFTFHLSIVSYWYSQIYSRNQGNQRFTKRSPSFHLHNLAQMKRIPVTNCHR